MSKETEKKQIKVGELQTRIKKMTETGAGEIFGFRKWNYNLTLVIKEKKEIGEYTVIAAYPMPSCKLEQVEYLMSSKGEYFLWLSLWPKLFFEVPEQLVPDRVLIVSESRKRDFRVRGIKKKIGKQLK